MDRFGEATAYLRCAIALAPDDAMFLLNASEMLNQTGDFGGMRCALQRALALAPDFAPAEYMLGIACMLLGDLKNAWRCYEARFRPPQVVRPRPFPQPWWDGGPLRGRLLVWGEQGLGDHVTFGSMLPDLVDSGFDTVLEVDPRLVPIYARSFPAFEVVPQADPPDARLAANDIEAQIAMGSLGAVLRPSAESFQATGAYFVADERRRAAACRWLDSLGPAPKVGVAWRSMRRDLLGRRVHTRLDEWTPILTVPGVTFVNLQYDDCAEELRQAAESFGATIHQMPSVDLFRDLEGVLALSVSLDLVIATGTSAYTFAAAAGVESWLLRLRTDYFGLGGDTYPWFARIRDFIREPGEDWRQPIRDVAEALQRRVLARGAPSRTM
jgi:tetratricopeptide (TPR) repeat protein